MTFWPEHPKCGRLMGLMLKGSVVLIIRAQGVKPGSKEKQSSQVLELDLALGDLLCQRCSKHRMAGLFLRPTALGAP